MKKLLLVLLMPTMISLPVLAVMTTDDAKSVDYIQHHGYSPETSRLIDLENSQINNVNTTYKSDDPDWYTSNKKANWIRKLFIYVDPALEDGNFGNNKIQYTTKWNEL